MISKRILVGLGLALTVTGMALGLAPQTPKPQSAETARVAKTIVIECAGVRPNELVLIEGGTRDVELLENFAIEARKLGAHPMIVLGSERLTRSMFTEIPAKFDNQEPAFVTRLAETIDVIINVDPTEQPGLLSDIDAKRLSAHRAAFAPIAEKMRERGVVSVELGNGLYPTKARAEQFGIAQPELSKLFWDAVNCDYQQLQTIGANVRTKLANGKTVHITAPNGTDLTVEVTQRPVFVSDGVVSDEDRYAKGAACQVWLPAGEVYVTPVPNTAKGTFVADNFYFEGKRIDGLTLKFDGGKLTSMTAKGDIAPLKARYDAAPTGKDLFAAIDIGINPKIQPTGKLATWIGSGTISVGFGDNTWAGGDNSCPFDVFAHLNGGTLTIDNTKLIDNGKLLEK